MTAAETRDLMKRLARYVFDHHLKKDPRSEQRGMVYEYFDVTRRGQFDQFVQGEGLDTMHDGAWLAAAFLLTLQQEWTKNMLQITRTQVYRIAYGLLPRRHWTREDLLWRPHDTQLRNERLKQSHARLRVGRRQLAQGPAP